MKLIFIIMHLFNFRNATCFTNNLNIKSMNFNLNRDSLWLSYPLKSTSFGDMTKKIPNTHVLKKCKIFKEDKLDYRLFFNCFEVKTNFFSGNRLEVVTIANNINNNKPSFIILDCFTNIMSWDPIDGIQNANCNIKNINTNSKYNVIINSKNGKNIFNLASNKSKIQKSVLTDFSIEPNYVCYFKNYKKGYNLLFSEKQINKKVILLKDIKLYNCIYKKYIKELEHSFIYPQEMKFKVLF